MRIVVIGAGGVGGYFGARLAQAGHDVAFVARGAHLEAIRERGLAIESAHGNAVVRATATADVASLGPVDAAMLCVKLWDVEPAARMLKPVVANGGVVIPFQNGVDAPQMLSDVLGAAHVLGGIAYIAATIREPGVVVHTGTMARLRVGAFQGGPVDRAAAFVAACKAAGIDAEHSPDIRRALWEKFVFLASMSGLTSVARQPVGVIRSDPDLRAAMQSAMQEVFDLGRARGVALPEGFVAAQLAFMDGLPHEMRSSMQNDLAAGNRLEAPWLSGAVARMARETGIAAPVHATLYAALKPYVDGARPQP
jgi:2-dehydropantoate 2-reductase